MTSLKSISIGTVVSLIFFALSAPSAVARGGYMKGGFDGGLFRMEHMASELELTDAQRDDFERIMKEGREEARPHVQRMISVRKEMRQFMDAEAFDETAVRSLATKKSASMTELTVIHARTRFEFKSILTPEQRQKLEDLKGRRDFHR